VTMPAPDQYQKLLEMLRGRAAAFEEAEDDRGRLQVALESYRHVLMYLRSDSEVNFSTVLRPLEFLRVKASDIERGAKPFDFKPDGAGTKPTGTQRENIQGMLAYAFEVLISGDFSQDEALRWLTSEIRKAGVRTENDSAIPKDQIRDWRNEIRRKAKLKATRGAPMEACGTYELLRQKFSPELRSLDGDREKKQRRARVIALSLIKVVRDAGPNLAPDRRLKR
jgi:hypothetical protein